TVLDADLLAEQGNFLFQLMAFGGKSNARTGAVARPAARVNEGVFGQSDDVQKRRLDRARPLLGHRQGGISKIWHATSGVCSPWQESRLWELCASASRKKLTAIDFVGRCCRKSFRKTRSGFQSSLRLST